MAVKKTFSHKLGDHVFLANGSNAIPNNSNYGGPLTGTVIGRAHYLDIMPQYLVEYVDAQGNPTSQWFYDREIESGSDEGDA